MTNGLPRYLTIGEAAELARVPPATVRYWCSLGRLPSYRPGRHRLIRSDVLVRFLEGDDQAVK
jgi:excisionase family DNA binding protein